jgi:acetylornithine deacetylase
MQPDLSRLPAVIDELGPYMIDVLSGFVAAQSPSGAEQPAAVYLEEAFNELGLGCEHILLDTRLISDMPLYSCPCSADHGRYNLLARHLPRVGGGRSVLFNGHLDVVPTGPDDLWTRPPFLPWVEDGWLHGRGAGDMKGGIVCALAAYKALHRLRLQPAGIVGFNAVLEEENTGNGTLATLHALQNGLAKARLTDFDAVIIPEPFAETIMSAQVGVCWLTVELTGRPAHVAYMGQGINPIEAGIAVMSDLKQMEAEWNAPENRHPLFRDATHPINFNLGRIEGGEWNSSVPCRCTLGLRFSFFPGISAQDARRMVSERIRATVARLNPALRVEIRDQGHSSPGCTYDLDAPAVQALAQAHRGATGSPPKPLACTATTDGRHFALTTDLPTMVYGPVARNIHGVDEAVSLDSMARVATAMALFLVDWCGVEPVTA